MLSGAAHVSKCVHIVTPTRCYEDSDWSARVSINITLRAYVWVPPIRCFDESDWLFQLMVTITGSVRSLSGLACSIIRIQVSFKDCKASLKVPPPPKKRIIHINYCKSELKQLIKLIKTSF